MSRDQRHQTSNELIRYPRLSTFQIVIKRHHEMSKAHGEPQYLILDGPHRSGKTWLVRDYARTFPIKKTEEEGLEMPVMYLLMPPLVTTEILARKMLDTLVSPTAYKENKISLDAHLIELIRASQVELIVLDNFYQLAARHSSWKTIDEVLDWLLALTQETRVSLLVIAVDDSSEILYSHPHLSQYFVNPMSLTPFQWNPAESVGLQYFANLVWTAAAQLGTRFIYESGRDTELLSRIHYATDGIIGYLMDLLYHAVEIMHEQNKDALDVSILSMAFERYHPVSMMRKENPFLAPRGETFLRSGNALRNSTRTRRKAIGIKKPVGETFLGEQTFGVENV